MDFIHLDFISAFSVLPPLLIGLSQGKRLNTELRLVTLMLVCSALADGLSYIFVSRNINSWPIVNAYFIVQFTLLYLVFSHNYSNNYFKLLFFAFTMFSLVNYLVIQSPFEFNSTSSYLGALFMLLLALFYLYRLFKDLPVERVQDLPMLWIAFAVLIYFGGTLFVFLFNNYLIVNEPGTHSAIWILHNMLNVAKNVFLSIALWKHYTQSRSPG